MLTGIAGARRGAARLAGAVLACVAAVLWMLVSTARVSPASADAVVDLRLVLAVDTSGSVNEMRFELQKQGYVDAFRNARVLNAILSGTHRAIAVTVTQWTGPALQVQVVPWTIIHDEASMHGFAAALDAVPRRLFSGGTSISGAIDHAAGLLVACPFNGPRNVIDVSGDGANNRGRPAAAARDDAVQAGIVINGLPILELEANLDQHYQNNVIGGPNSFMVPASTFAEFGDAILKKLIVEIAEVSPPRLPLLRRAMLDRGAMREPEVCAKC